MYRPCYLLLPIALAVLLHTGSLPAIAQMREQPSPADTTLAGQVELARLVDLAAQRLRVNIEYDASALRSAVTLRLGAGVSDEELWSLTNRLLASRGFTTVRTAGHGAFSVVRIQDAAGLAQVQQEWPPGDEPQPGFQSLVVRIRHKPVRDIVEAVGRLLSKPGGAAAGLGDEGLLLISDLTPRLEQALEFIRLMDVPGPSAVLEEIPLHNVAAKQLATLATEIAGKRRTATGERIEGELIVPSTGRSLLVLAPESNLGYWRELVGSLDQGEPLETHWYTPLHFAVRDVAQLIEEAVRDPNEPADGRWRMVLDELTGTLLITATPDRHSAVRSLLDRLDAVPHAARRAVRSFVIKNRDANDVLRVLETLVRSGVLDPEDTPASDRDKPGPQRTDVPVAPGAAPPVATTPQVAFGTEPLAHSTASTQTHGSVSRRATSTTDGLLLTVDEGTNTLIAAGNPRMLSQIESLLETLDVRQPQVMLEVLLLSLSESQTLDLGIELEQLVTAGDISIRLSSLFGLSARGPAGTRVVGDGAGFTGVVLSPGDFAVVLRALQNVNKGRSLSMPKLLVANNQSAVLNSVLQQPFATINATPTVATTSFGGTQDAGTTVSIRPQIAQGDHLILHYSVALSSFVGSAPAAGLPPPRQQNQVQSLATIPDGYTVVVGGIELENHSQAIAQIPLLGNIPILGEAFKSRAHASNRSRFYVFIRANILRGRGFEDLKYISNTNVAATESQIDDGWPKVEPRIIH